MPAAAQSEQAAPAPGQRVEIRSDDGDDAERRRQDPVAKTIVGRDELDRHSDTNVADVLKRQPGVNLDGGNPRLRGLGAGYTLILVNGDRPPPGFSLDNLSPAMVERIEITRGPTAEHSAQAVAGTINIVLRQAISQRQREWRLGLAYNHMRPEPSVNAVLADRLGDWSLTLPVSAYRWRGGSSNQSDRRTRDAAGLPQQLLSDNLSRWWGGGANVGPRAQWQLSADTSVELQVFAQRNDWRSAGESATEVLEGSAPTSVQDRYANLGHWQTWRASAQWTRKWRGGARLEARAGHQSSQGRWQYVVLGSDATGARSVERVSDGSTTERSQQASVKLSLPAGEEHRLTLGAESERRSRDEARRVVENGLPQLVDFEGIPFGARIERVAAYVQDEWEWSTAWSASLGLRAERIDVRDAGAATGAAADLSGGSRVVSPLLHLRHRLRPGSRDLLRASLTRSYRAPDLNSLLARPAINGNYPVSGANTEIAADRVGNPGLKPELATGIDLAWESYPGAGAVLSVGLFHRRISGLMRPRISLEGVPWSAVPRWVSRPSNLAAARSTGLELEAKGPATLLLPLSGPLAQAVLLRASAAWYRSTVDDIPGPDNRLEGQQPWSVTLGVDRPTQLGRTGFGATWTQTPAFDIRQDQRQWQRVGSVRSLDAYLAWTLQPGATLRLAASHIAPASENNRLRVMGDDGFEHLRIDERQRRTSVNLQLVLKF